MKATIHSNNIGFDLARASRSNLIVPILIARWRRYGVKFSWALVSSVLLQIQTLALTIVIARCVAPEVFGKYALLLSTLSTAVSIAGLSLGMTATRCVATNLDSDQSSLRKSLALCKAAAFASGIIAAALLAALAPRVSGELLGRPELIGVLRWCTPYVFFMTLNGFQTGALAGFLAFRESAQINVVQLFVALGSTAILTARFGLPGIMASLVISAFSTWIHTDLVLRRVLKQHRIKLDYRCCLADHRPVTQVALPASAAGMIGSVALWALTAINSKQPGGFLVVGAFAIATNFRLATLFVPVILQRVLAAHLSRAEYRGNPGAFKRLYWKGVAGSVLVAAIIAMAILFGRPLLIKTFGRSQGIGVSFLILLLASGVVEAYATAVYQVIATTASLGWQLLTMSIWSPLLITVGWIFAHRGGGASGMAMALLCAWVAGSLMYTAIAGRLLGRLGHQ